MTAKELRDYCYSIGLIDTDFIFKDIYTNGYRFNSEFVNYYDFIAAWDKSKQCVVVANGCVTDEDYKHKCKIRMIGSTGLKMKKKSKLALKI